MNFAADISTLPADASPPRRERLTLIWRGKSPPVPDITLIDVTEEVAPVERVARVLEVTPWTEPDGLDVCLDRWRGWMHRNDADMSTQTMKSLCGEGDGYGSDETATARRNNEIGEATDAMIRSLSASHRWAIWKKCGITTQWSFPRLDFMVEAIDACALLEKKLRENVATRTIFL